MSSYSYGNYEIREKERKRLEQERKRRQEEERRRQEEERRRQEEERRRQEVAAEKKRIDIAKHFREISRSLLLRKETTAKKIGVFAEKEDTSAKMMEMAQTMRDQLAAFPSQWHEHFRDRLEQAQEAIEKVEKGNFDQYFYNRLKQSCWDLGRLVATAEEEIENNFRRIRELRKRCEDLIIDLAVVRETAIFEEQRRQARTLIDMLEALTQEKEPDFMADRLEQLGIEVRRLQQEVVQTQEEEHHISFVRQNVMEVLKGMGYRVIEAQPAVNTVVIQEHTAKETLYFRTPQKGVLEMNLTKDASLSMHYALPRIASSPLAKISPDEAVVGCENWCRDYEVLLSSLAERNINFREKMRIDPRENSFKEVLVAEDYFEDEESIYSHEEAPKRREL